MKRLTVVNIEKAIREFETIRGLNLDMEVSVWDLAKHIWKYIEDIEG